MIEGEGRQISGKAYPQVEIVPATLRDLTFIAANMRAEDWREIACQFPEGITRTEIAALAGQFGESWVAVSSAQPVAAFGAAPLTCNVLTGWAWGTRRMRRAVPAITRFMREDCAPRWVDAGITRLEARSIAGHDEAHKWMRALGADEQPCPEWGRDGEDFILFSWTKERQWKPMTVKRARTDRITWRGSFGMT